MKKSNLKKEHEHIPHKHKDWSAHNYQCVCGFKTGDRIAFDKHLKENNKTGG